ncbi:MAG: HAD family hydrolase [Nanoarchaeota archaeon]|nr:HAD family hydrolase [Nanoarchaeota archaeon]
MRIVPLLKINLDDCFSRHPGRRMNIDRFANFFHLNQLPVKNFSVITDHYGIGPDQVYVIGDSDKDMGGAQELGCGYFRVPAYNGSDDFSFSIVVEVLQQRM